LSPASATADGGPPQLTGATPISIFLREHHEAWGDTHREHADQEAQLRPGARAVLAALQQRGPSFLNDLAALCTLDRDALRYAVGALVACGLASSDGFAGLRALLSPESPAHRGRGQFAGRWTVTRREERGGDREHLIEIQAWALLRRYGVIFRRLVTREPNAAPWRELTRTYRRLEARGEIRGGRFVAGMSGEQFALPDAVDRLREVRRTALDGRLHTVSTADPLNLAGILTAGERIRTAARNSLVYRDGLAIAVVENEVVRDLVPLDSATLLAISRSARRGTPLLTR
jgi:ATP-dependent Lhr-like helicase